jgi:hypothetical protein
MSVIFIHKSNYFESDNSLSLKLPYFLNRSLILNLHIIGIIIDDFTLSCIIKNSFKFEHSTYVLEQKN